MRRVLQKKGHRPAVEVVAPVIVPMRDMRPYSISSVSANGYSGNERVYRVYGFYVPETGSDEDVKIWTGDYSEHGVRVSRGDMRAEYDTEPELLPETWYRDYVRGPLKPVPDDDPRWDQLPGRSSASGLDSGYEVEAIRESRVDPNTYLVSWIKTDDPDKGQRGKSHYSRANGVRSTSSASGPPAFDIEMLRALYTDATAKPLRRLPAPAKPTVFVRTVREWNRERREYQYRVYAQYSNAAQEREQNAFTSGFGFPDFNQDTDSWVAVYDASDGHLIYHVSGVQPPSKINLREAVKVLEGD